MWPVCAERECLRMTHFHFFTRSEWTRWFTTPDLRQIKTVGERSECTDVVLIPHSCLSHSDLWRHLERYTQISHIHIRMNINAHPGSFSLQPLGQKYMTTISVSCFSGNETMSKAIMLAVQNTGSSKLPNAQVKSKSAQHKTYCTGVHTNSCNLC